MALALRIKLVVFAGALALLLPAAAGTSEAAAATLTRLYTFCQYKNCTDGAQPAGGLVRDNAGNLYSTAAGGTETVCYSGSHGITETCGGVVFEVSPNADQTAWSEQVLYGFCARPDCADGANPSGELIMDSSGNLYGTAADGGAGIACPDRTLGCGVVFELSPNADHTGWTEKVLHRFCRQPNCADGANPSGALMMDASGNLYGTTQAGGAGCPGSNITPESTSYSCGVVFELSPNRRKTRWREKVLYTFCQQQGCADGRDPTGGLIMDASGNLYGTTRSGGNNAACLDYNTGCSGIVFALSPNPGQTGWSETILYTFCQQAGCADGMRPNGSLIMDAAGDLYGTTAGGVGNGSGSCLGAASAPLVPCGVAFELSPNPGQTGWSETVLYTFCQQGRCADGADPYGGLVMGAAGRLYGATAFGGRTTRPRQCRQAGGCGTLFVLFPNADGTARRERVLYRFCTPAGCADGKQPSASPIMDAAGDLYGTTLDGGPRSHGTVFVLTR